MLESAALGFLPRRVLARVVLLLSCLAAMLFAALPGRAAAEEDFLPPEQAFRYSARMADALTAEVHIVIAPGYYLYRERFGVDLTAASAAAGAKLGNVVLPNDSENKFDAGFQKVMPIWRQSVSVRIPVSPGKNGAAPQLQIGYQGCADKGLCYPPAQQIFIATLQAADAVPGAGRQPLTGGAASAANGQSAAAEPPPEAGLAALWAERDDANRLGALLAHGSLPLLALGFILLGLSLSFTPCVLPMVPILSAILVGDEAQTHEGAAPARRRHAFVLSLSYVLGMALSYTAAGVLAAKAGASLAVWLQTPLVLGVFALLLAALALSMFGFYHLDLPHWLRHRLHAANQGRKGGSLGGAFAIGAVSSLIVGPCITAPLAGLLALIAQTGEPLRGGVLLFFLALGMGVPLLLIGLGAGSLLPRAGAWMNTVQRVFGVLLLGVALWMITPILPAWAPMLLWALFLIVAAAYLCAYDRLPEKAGGCRYAWKGLGVAMAVYGAALILGLLAGGCDLLQPLAGLQGFPGCSAALVQREPVFAKVASLEELEAALKSAGRPAMLDFYADWCMSCKEMEKLTFSDPAVTAELDKLALLRADITLNNAEHQTLLKRFGLFGPPGIIFFDAQGREIPGSRVVGYQDASTFLKSLATSRAK
ncbi:MAG: protein-disulfide reductase DsbD [Candidatus Protistobacter heckmanni]|nr:protein-disulfide reductase DsbD [Candidatus Protistobacter heckmanni]